MPYKQYSDSYLLKMNKKEIIDLLRVAEHNFFATEEGLQNSARFGAEVLAENAELKKMLKLAAEAFEHMSSISCKYAPCQECIHYPDPNSFCDDDDCFKWRYADEAMKLIGDDVGER